MKKIILVFALLNLLFLPAAAAEADVVYDGKEVTVKDGASESINKAITGLYPGQTAEIEVTFSNGSSSRTAWYISNEILASLESGDAKNGGYTYQISYISPSGAATALYDDKSIGGDDTEGLKEANESLQDYRYLDTLAPGASARIRITVGLDGESQPNSYMDKLGELALRFAVEDQTENVIRVVNTSAFGEGKQDGYSIVMYASLTVAAACFLYLLLDRRGGKNHA